MQDIIIFGLARWDGEYSSTTLSLAMELSKHTRVFYVDNPFTLNAVVKDFKKPGLKRRLKALFMGLDYVSTPFPEYPQLHTVIPPAVLPINWINSTKIYDKLKRFNDRIILPRLGKLIKDMAIERPIYINIFNPFYLDHLDASFNPSLNIYFTVDNIGASAYIGKHGVRLEEKAFKNADFGLATSKQLQKYASAFNKTYYLPNAANIDLFTTAENDLEKPAELATLKGEIIVYTGNLSIREDYPLLKKIALRYPERHLVLVGPINTKSHLEQGLDQLPNVHFTGGKKLEELPAFLKYADCAIIPFIPNDLTAGIYPLKINEYLASKTPVVSTRFSEDIASFAPVCYLAENQEDFIDKIDLAIKENSAQLEAERHAFAKENNWSNRAKQLLDIIQNELSK